MFIKICGITSVTDARMVAAAGANAIGLNFYPSSPRSIRIEMAIEIVQSLPPFVDPIGLFVDSSTAEIRSTAQLLGLRTLQLHGQNTPQQIAELREFSIMPAFPIVDESSISSILSFVEECRKLGRMPSAILIDGYSAGQHGGTGQVAPWHLARSVVDQCPLPVALAGGLTAKNVADAVRAVRPWGVDVASSVEVAPGRKESYKVRKFIEEVHKVDVRRQPR